MEEDVIPEVYCSQTDMSTHVDEINIAGKDVEGVIIDDPMFDLDEQSNDDMQADYDSSESDEKDETLYDYDYD